MKDLAEQRRLGIEDFLLKENKLYPTEEVLKEIEDWNCQEKFLVQIKYYY